MNEVEYRKEVFAWYGAAAYVAQCFEIELIILLILAHRLKNPSLTPDQLDNIDQSLSDQSLGRLLNQLKHYFWFHPDFEVLLNDYLDKRNYLTHHFFHRNSFKFVTHKGCESMLTELKEIEASMREADEIAKAMPKRMREILGISEEVVEKLVEEELKEYGYKGPENINSTEPVAQADPESFRGSLAFRCRRLRQRQRRVERSRAQSSRLAVAPKARQPIVRAELFSIITNPFRPVIPEKTQLNSPLCGLKFVLKLYLRNVPQLCYIT